MRDTPVIARRRFTDLSTQKALHHVKTYIRKALTYSVIPDLADPDILRSVEHLNHHQFDTPPAASSPRRGRKIRPIPLRLQHLNKIEPASEYELARRARGL
jgi:hypothetical protein